MPPFDPAAATAAYLAQLSPAAQAKAIAYTHGGEWLVLWDAVISIAAAWLILKSGVLASIRNRLERRRPRPLLTAFLVALAFLLIEAVITLPWSIYESWWRERNYGLSSQPFGGWLAEAALSTAIGTVLTSIYLMLVYGLMRWTGRAWWTWAGVLTAGALVLLILAQPVVIEPLFNRYTPAPPGPVRDTVVALAKQSGVPSDKIYIYNGSKQSNRYTANVSGLFGSARVAMSDVMFRKGADIAEVRGVVGHEMGHYAHAHVLWRAAIAGVLAMATFWLVQRLFPWAARWSGAADARIADPAALPVIMIIAAVLGFLATPILNGETRIMEADADHFSLVHANEPDGMAKALMKTVEYRAASPSWLEEIVFYDHPSVSRRIRRAMDWKAAHPPAAAPTAARVL